ncbi:MAG TPA: ubiquinol-cytochrome c reductase cytochrome b subunit [Acidimicrobiales bacterium]|nr:ubiquinol-cytochrome c reductase cytochrome b subunit [Acidimicrobiales bacterium]
MKSRDKPRPSVEDRTIELARWVDDRFGVARFGKTTLNKIFPDHWSFLLGEIAMYSFVILIITGIFLTLFFVPSTHEVVYNGSYVPLRGQRVSEAYQSTVDLSLNVRAGLVMRQMHHWAADIFAAAVVVHLCRIFFTGAFRRPRELNYMIGLTMLILVIVNGFIGYSLPDDQISGAGLRIAFSIFLSIPIIGTWGAFLLWGGNFPGNGDIIPRFYSLHILIIPAVIAGLLAAHLGIMWHQKHTDFPGKEKTNRTVVGSSFWPTYVAKTTGYFFIIFAGLALLGGLFQINPIWLYGSYEPFKVSYAVQPDWYMGWLDGALRIMPAWETQFASRYLISAPFYPAVILPGLTFGILYAWPFIEARFRPEDKTQEHHLLDRPRDRPVRTGLGVGVLTFYVMLFFASSTDVLANTLKVSLNGVLWTFRIGTPTIPIVVGLATYQICKELSRAPSAGLRKRSNVVVRSPDGGYTTVPADIHPGDDVREPPPEELPEEAVRRGGGRGPEGGEEEVGVGADRSEATGVTPPRRFGGLLRPRHRPAGSS